MIDYKARNLIKHQDERGWFLEMVRRDGINLPIKQVSVASILPGHVRGNHYHLKKTEWFLAIGGSAKFYLGNPKTKKIRCFKLSNSKPKIITVFPKVAHAIKNVSKKTIYFIEVDSAVYNHKKPDAIVYQICK